MKFNLLVFFFAFTLFACKKNEDPQANSVSLISQNNWELVRFTDPSGTQIAQSSLNTEAKFLFALQFQFRNNGEVRGLDKQSKAIIQKGVWAFNEDKTAINVTMPGLNSDFKIIQLKTGLLTLQAPTDNFLSGVGSEINLEFTSVKQ